MMVKRLFLTVPLGCLRFVNVVFPDHTHLLFFTCAKVILGESVSVGHNSKFMPSLHQVLFIVATKRHYRSEHDWVS